MTVQAPHHRRDPHEEHAIRRVIDDGHPHWAGRVAFAYEVENGIANYGMILT